MSTQNDLQCPVCYTFFRTPGGRKSHQRLKNHYAPDEAAIGSISQSKNPHPADNQSNPIVVSDEDEMKAKQKKREKKLRQKAKRQAKVNSIRDA
jgi:hypothetical protein